MSIEKKGLHTKSASGYFLHHFCTAFRCEVKTQRYKSIHLKNFSIQFLIAIIIQYYLRKVSNKVTVKKKFKWIDLRYRNADKNTLPARQARKVLLSFDPREGTRVSMRLSLTLTIRTSTTQIFTGRGHYLYNS